MHILHLAVFTLFVLNDFIVLELFLCSTILVLNGASRFAYMSFFIVESSLKLANWDCQPAELYSCIQVSFITLLVKFTLCTERFNDGIQVKMSRCGEHYGVII